MEPEASETSNETVSQPTPGTSQSADRFVLPTEQDLQDLLDQRNSKNTIKATHSAVKTFRDYLSYMGQPQEFETFDKTKLDLHLKNFYAGARREDGKPYRRTALCAMRYGVNRYLSTKYGIDIIKDPAFHESNQMFSAVGVELKRNGYDTPNHFLEITGEDLRRLYSDPHCFNTNTPSGLLHKVLFEVMLHLCRRPGRKKLRSMNKSTFRIGKDSTGLEYVYQVPDGIDWNNKDYVNLFPNNPEGGLCMYAVPGHPNCPVQSFRKYLSKLNPTREELWQRPVENATSRDAVWYANTVLGKNTLGVVMKTLSKAANLSQEYTNQSVRVTSITMFNAAVFHASNIGRSPGYDNRLDAPPYPQYRDLTGIPAWTPEPTARSYSPPPGPFVQESFTPVVHHSSVSNEEQPPGFNLLNKIYSEEDNQDQTDSKMSDQSDEENEENERFEFVESNYDNLQEEDEEKIRSLDDLPSNTKHCTIWARKVWGHWANWRNGKMGEDSTERPVPVTDEQIAALSDCEMARFLSLFVVEVRNQQGKKYPPDTLYSITHGLNRYVKIKLGKPLFNMYDGRGTFRKFNAILQSTVQKLKEEFSNKETRTSQPLTPEIEGELWERNVFNTNTAVGLSRAVFFYVSKAFGILSKNEHRDLKIEDFVFGEDGNGKYVQLKTKIQANKDNTLTGSSDASKIYDCPLNPRSIYKLLYLYLDVLKNGTMALTEGPFYRQPKLVAKITPTGLNRLCFYNLPIGHNTLSKYIKIMMQEGGFDGFYSNNSMKALIGVQSGGSTPLNPDPPMPQTASGFMQPHYMHQSNVDMGVTAGADDYLRQMVNEAYAKVGVHPPVTGETAFSGFIKQEAETEDSGDSNDSDLSNSTPDITPAKRPRWHSQLPPLSSLTPSVSSQYRDGTGCSTGSMPSTGRGTGIPAMNFSATSAAESTTNSESTTELKTLRTTLQFVTDDNHRSCRLSVNEPQSHNAQDDGHQFLQTDTTSSRIPLRSFLPRDGSISLEDIILNTSIDGSNGTLKIDFVYSVKK